MNTSGGIDSPVAGFRMAKRGMQISAIHFHSYPFTSIQAKEKVIELGQIISSYCGHFPLFVVQFFTRLFVTVMLSRVCDATCPKLSPVINAPQFCEIAIFSDISIIIIRITVIIKSSRQY